MSDVVPAASASPAATPAAAAPAAAASAIPPAAPAASIPLAADPAAASAAAPAQTAPATFPTNWREILAGDPNAAKDLEKYTDPTAVYKSLRDVQAKISKGELRPAPMPLAANATSDQKAEWRRANGMPDSAEAMVKGMKLPDGVVIGEADKPLVEGFAKALFEEGASQAEMDRSVSWFYKQQDAIEQQRTDQDGQTRMNSEVALRGKWGQEYVANMSAMGAALATLPENVRAAMLSARGPDGQMLGNSAAFVEAMAQLGRELNPAATVVPHGDGNAAQTIENEIETIKKSMYDQNGTPNRAYWQNEKAQARYRELIDAQTKMGQRSTRAA